jgi:hypothetical protein
MRISKIIYIEHKKEKEMGKRRVRKSNNGSEYNQCTL